MGADSINTFKNRFDKYWINQVVVYNYKSEITGIGRSASLYVMLCYLRCEQREDFLHLSHHIDWIERKIMSVMHGFCILLHDA